MPALFVRWLLAIVPRKLWPAIACGVLGVAVGFLMAPSTGAPSADWVRAHERVESPSGYHCWSELNSSQPGGLEKICAADVSR